MNAALASTSLHHQRGRIRLGIGIIIIKIVNIIRVIRCRIKITLVHSARSVVTFFGVGVILSVLLVIVADKSRLVAWREGNTVAAAGTRTHAKTVVVIAVWTAAPGGLLWLAHIGEKEGGSTQTYYAQSQQCVDLDQTVEVPEDD